MGFDPQQKFFLGTQRCAEPFLYRGQGRTSFVGEVVRPVSVPYEYRPCPLIYATDQYALAAAYALSGMGQKCSSSVSYEEIDGHSIPLVQFYFDETAYADCADFYDKLRLGRGAIQTLSSTDFTQKIYPSTHADALSVEWCSAASTIVKACESVGVKDVLRKGVQLFIMPKSFRARFKDCARTTGFLTEACAVSAREILWANAREGFVDKPDVQFDFLKKYLDVPDRAIEPDGLLCVVKRAQAVGPSMGLT